MQLCQTLPVVEGTLAGNGKKPSDLGSFTPESLKLWTAPSPPLAEGASGARKTVSWKVTDEMGTTRTTPFLLQPGRGPAFPVTSVKPLSETSAKHLCLSPFGAVQQYDLSLLLCAIDISLLFSFTFDRACC